MYPALIVLPGSGHYSMTFLNSPQKRETRLQRTPGCRKKPHRHGPASRWPDSCRGGGGIREPSLDRRLLQRSLGNRDRRSAQPATCCRRSLPNRPDIVSLQEIQRELEAETGFEDQPVDLQSVLDLGGVYGPTVSLDPADIEDIETDLGDAERELAREFGNLILTVGTVLSCDYDTLTSPDDGGQRGYITAVVEYGGTEIRVVNPHLGLSPAVREKQLDKLLDTLGTLKRPTLLTGDFNAVRISQQSTG